MIIKLLTAGIIIQIALGLAVLAYILLTLIEKLWSKWRATTRSTVWFFDYAKNRRKYEIWLKEQESKEEQHG